MINNFSPSNVEAIFELERKLNDNNFQKALEIIRESDDYFFENYDLTSTKDKNCPNLDLLCDIVKDLLLLNPSHKKSQEFLELYDNSLDKDHEDYNNSYELEKELLFQYNNLQEMDLQNYLKTYKHKIQKSNDSKLIFKIMQDLNETAFFIEMEKNKDCHLEMINILKYIIENNFECEARLLALIKLNNLCPEEIKNCQIENLEKLVISELENHIISSGNLSSYNYLDVSRILLENYSEKYDLITTLEKFAYSRIYKISDQEISKLAQCLIINLEKYPKSLEALGFMLKYLTRENRNVKTSFDLIKTLHDFENTRDLSVQSLVRLFDWVSLYLSSSFLEDNLNDRNDLYDFYDVFSDSNYELFNLLKTIDSHQLLIILISGLRSYQNKHNHVLINHDVYSVLFHCAQNISYPEFYQAWHSQTKTPHPEVEPTDPAEFNPSLEQQYLRETLSQLEATTNVYPIPIDADCLVEETDKSAIAQELLNQIYETTFPDINSPTANNAPQIKQHLPEIKHRLQVNQLALILYNCNPESTPELQKLCRQLSRQLKIAWITEQPLEPPLQGFQLQPNLQNVLQNWLNEI